MPQCDEGEERKPVKEKKESAAEDDSVIKASFSRVFFESGPAPGIPTTVTTITDKRSSAAVVDSDVEVPDDNPGAT